MFLNHKIANVTNEPVLEAIALTMIPGIGVKGAVHLLETFGDARAVFDAPLDELTGRAELRPDSHEPSLSARDSPKPKRNSVIAPATV